MIDEPAQEPENASAQEAFATRKQNVGYAAAHLREYLNGDTHITNGNDAIIVTVRNLKLDPKVRGRLAVGHTYQKDPEAQMLAKERGILPQGKYTTLAAVDQIESASAGRLNRARNIILEDIVSDPRRRDIIKMDIADDPENPGYVTVTLKIEGKDIRSQADIEAQQAKNPRPVSAVDAAVRSK